MKYRNYRSNESKPLKELVNALFKSYGLENKMQEMDLINAWPELMGPAVAHRTSQIKIKNKVLILKIDSSVMREELLFGKQIIIDRLNEYAGKEFVKDIWFS